MRWSIARWLGILLLVAAATSVAAPTPTPLFGSFFFSGYGLVPSTLGGTLTVRMILIDQVGYSTPIPLDFTTMQHTLIVSGTLDGISPTEQHFGNASLAIYSDPIAGGTAANYADPATFTDGDLILSGTFDTLSRFTIVSPSSIYGHLRWTGGSRFGELDYPPCYFGASYDPAAPGLPAGYDEGWAGEMQAIVDAVEPRGWGAVKALFR